MIFRLMLIALLSASTASALETSAGTDTVNASQIGLDAKLNASTAALGSVINQILTCNRTNQLYDSVTHGCRPARAADSDVQAILACARNNQLYDFTTKACKPPRAADSDMSNVLTCAQNQQFYDKAHNTCIGGGNDTFIRKAFYRPSGNLPGNGCPFPGYSSCVKVKTPENGSATIDLGIVAKQCWLTGAISWTDNDRSLTLGGGLYADSNQHWYMRAVGTAYWFLGWSVACVK